KTPRVGSPFEAFVSLLASDSTKVNVQKTKQRPNGAIKRADDQQNTMLNNFSAINIPEPVSKRVWPKTNLTKDSKRYLEYG
ncbi:hypothetical protein DDM91_19465, partial [Vibrio cholerae]|nr:hypothetical protein [Vibrio cholerae]